ncbi:unnamed protein product [Protopolystoma xenopodis]|uniref:Uncharacterized protein n=1 Tax=Protopolystoma xenopodis TaxID=117903 RepID=A0A3S4ZNM7_9PLAT|nr:unnamed protein product [Protopolystoma xenopodis]
MASSLPTPRRFRKSASRNRKGMFDTCSLLGLVNNGAADDDFRGSLKEVARSIWARESRGSFPEFDMLGPIPAAWPAGTCGSEAPVIPASLPQTTVPQVVVELVAPLAESGDAVIVATKASDVEDRVLVVSGADVILGAKSAGDVVMLLPEVGKSDSKLLDAFSTAKLGHIVGFRLCIPTWDMVFVSTVVQFEAKEGDRTLKSLVVSSSGLDESKDSFLSSCH